MLSDPARRDAYDRAVARERQPAARVPVRRPASPGGTDRITPLIRVPGPPLRAGPVRVDGPRPAPPAGGRDEEDMQEMRLAVLAELARRYLARDRGRPW